MRSPDILIFMRMTGNFVTCMYYAGIDAFTGKQVYSAKHPRDRKVQRAFLQFFKPENCFQARDALMKAGRSDLIGPAATA